jgi:hypothetical protein
MIVNVIRLKLHLASDSYSFLQFIRNVSLALLPTVVATMVSAACFQVTAWTGSYLSLFAGMILPIVMGLPTAVIVQPHVLSGTSRWNSLYYVGQFVAILACVVALAPPER